MIFENYKKQVNENVLLLSNESEYIPCLKVDSLLNFMSIIELENDGLRSKLQRYTTYNYIRSDIFTNIILGTSGEYGKIKKKKQLKLIFEYIIKHQILIKKAY